MTFIIEKYGEEFAEERKQELNEIIYKLEKKCVRKMIYVKCSHFMVNCPSRNSAAK